MRRLLDFGANLFPFWVVLAGGLALLQPELFTWFDKPKIIWGLAIIMLGMGINLNWEDFRGAFSLPKEIALGVFLQYSVMPLAAFLIADGLKLPTPFAVGLILVACCPGGTASNIVAFLARANLPLSVLLTTASTFLSMLATPLLAELYIGTRVPVDVFGLFLTTVQVVIAPVALGVLLNRFAPKAVARLRPVSPLVAVLAVAMIVGSIVGANKDEIIHLAPTLFVAVVTLHVVGFGLGYWIPLLLGLSGQNRRTISIEVGMQNSGLGVVLARSHFVDPLSAVPGALSAVAHSVIGSLLAVIWRLRPTKEERLKRLPGEYVISEMH
ncbi:MAG: bile acid:sodium symporter family protein [Verrucomicrobiota bacterium]